MRTARLLVGDVRERLRGLPEASVQCVVTSPPYFGLRDYGHDGQIGLEASPADYVAALVATFAQVRRCLRDDGTLWLNLGDSYAGSWGAHGRPQGPSGEMATRSVIHARQIHAHPKFDGLTGTRGREMGLKPKDLMMIPARVAIALQADGWYLRSEIIWHKPNPMPESVTDRPTKAHEQIFLLSKNERYYYDSDAIKIQSVDEPGKSRGGSLSRFGRDEQLISANAHRGDKEPVSSGFANKRTVWTVATQPYPEAHFATYPEDLIEPCILAGSKVGDTVLDPFTGSGTTGVVACRHNRHFIGVELNPAYAHLAERRIRADASLLNSVEVA